MFPKLIVWCLLLILTATSAWAEEKAITRQVSERLIVKTTSPVLMLPDKITSPDSLH